VSTLREVIARVDELTDEAVVYASRPWSPQASVVVATGDEHPEGRDYLLEVVLIREVLTVWSDWRGGRPPTPDEAVQAVIYYATHDAYQPDGEAL
jgi:hypothetical protein